MGLLKSMVRDAVSEGVRKGIGKAVGQAVGDAIRPSVEKVAKESADLINSTTQSIDKGASEVRAASVEADQKIQAAGGLSALESALGGLTSRAERYAAEMSKNMKICPSCGEACTADKTFCPKCGTKLPEETLAESYTCKQCGYVNVPETKYCTKCGAILPAAEAEVKAQQEKDAAVLADLSAQCPDYPAWTVGGTGFELENRGMMNGYDSYGLTFEGKREIVLKYVEKLRAAGFTARDAEIFSKIINGVCRTFIIGDSGAADYQTVIFRVDNYKKPEPKKPQDDALTSIAKGLFKKFNI